MDELQRLMIIASLFGIVAIVGAILKYVTRPNPNPKGTISTTRETIEWFEEDPITNQKRKHSKVIITQERV